MKKIYKLDDGLVPIDASTIGQVERAGFQLVQMPCRTRQDIVARCHDASALIVMGETIDREVIEGLPALKAVARCGVGIDRIDLVAATERGVQVTNVPNANLEEVAMHTIAFVLALTRRLFAYDASTRIGRCRERRWRRRSASFGVSAPTIRSTEYRVKEYGTPVRRV